MSDEIWPDEPSTAAQKDVDARWTLKIGGKIRCRPDGTSLPQIALPVFGYKSHIAIDRRLGFIRESTVTSAAQVDGRMLPRHPLPRRLPDSAGTCGSPARCQEPRKR